jgi:hypothetical protein
MDTFAHDSYEYQGGAVRLAEVLRKDGAAAWASLGQPLHVRLISLQFALLGPLTGYGPLSAEPLNLLCYLAVVGLTLLLGREVGGARAGLLAAAAVALWPTLLLHTLQLLKDPLFIAAALALVLCVTTWLTRDYGRAGAAAACVLMGVGTCLLLLIRVNFAVVIFALVLTGFTLLAVRQWTEGLAALEHGRARRDSGVVRAAAGVAHPSQADTHSEAQAIPFGRRRTGEDGSRRGGTGADRRQVPPLSAARRGWKAEASGTTGGRGRQERAKNRRHALQV